MKRAAKPHWPANIDTQERCIQLAKYMIENKSTVRATAVHFGISNSTVHKDLAEKLPHINRLLYEDAKTIMDMNKAERHIRGGKATQNKYRSLRDKK